VVAPSNTGSGAVDNGTAGNTFIDCTAGSGLELNNLVILSINVLGSGVTITPPATDVVGGHPAWNLVDTQMVNGDYEQEIFWHEVGSAEVGGPSFMFSFPGIFRAACAAATYHNTCLDSGSACTDPIFDHQAGQSTASSAVTETAPVSVPNTSLVVGAFGTTDTNSKFGDSATNPPGTTGNNGANQHAGTISGGPNMSPVNGVEGNNGGITINNLTEIASGTDGPWRALLPQTGKFPTIGIIAISGNGSLVTGTASTTPPLDQYRQPSYTATIANVGGGSPSGCFDGTFVVTPQVPTTTTNGITSFPTSTISVLSTTGFLTAGEINIDGQVVTYTGTTATSFTGVSGGSGSVPSGSTVTGQSTVFTYSDAGCSGTGSTSVSSNIMPNDPGEGDNAAQVLSIIPNLP